MARTPWFLACSLVAVAAQAQMKLPPPVAAAPAQRLEGDAPVMRRTAVASVTRNLISWPSARFTYKADGKPISEVLQDFAASQGLPAVLAEGIQGTVSASFDSMPDRFLATMNKAYGVQWYHDGMALYFYPANAVQSRLFRLKGFGRGQVTELLDSLQLGDKRFPLRFNSTESTLLVYGPPRHIELVAVALESLEAGAVERSQRVVRVVPLRYASAADRQFGQTNVPGLATTLQALYSAGNSSTSNIAESQATPSAGIASADKLRSLTGLTGLSATAGQGGSPAATASAQRKDGPASQPSTSFAKRGISAAIDEETPTFHADAATNAILVHGRPQKMNEYMDLIRRLDVRQQLVELEVTIIDISSDAIDALGVAWSVATPTVSAGVTPPNSSAAGSSVASASGFGISTLWSNAGRQLLSRVDALSATGKARVVAKPKVLGVANRAAVMEEKRTAVVRVAGNLEANLFQIEAGTLLNVTPQVTQGPTGTHIKLSLHIEDGSFEAGSLVDGVPTVKRTQISTEAHVAEGESLLIGGITSDSTGSQNNEVPGLSRIPIFGALFRQTSDKRQHTERLFLITPRLLRDAERLPTDTAADAVAPAPPTPPAMPPAPARSIDNNQGVREP